MASLANILERKWRGAHWSLSGDDFETLVWMDPTVKPSEADIRKFSGEVDGIMRREEMVVTPMQFRLALLATGLLDACDAAVAAAPVDVKIRWEYAVAVHRLNPFIESFGAAMGKTPAEIDAIFEAAALIEG